MMLWKILLSELLNMVAYAAIALALFRLFRQSHAAVLGRARWAIVLVAATTACLHVAIGLATPLKAQALVSDLGLLKAICQLVVGISLWRLLRHLQPGLSRALGRRGRARLKRALAEAGQAHIWMELAAPLGHFGHWRVNLASHRLDWSDEMYRIHGVTADDFNPTLEAAMALFHPDDRNSVTTSFEAALSEGPEFEVKARIRRPDSELRHVVLRARAVERDTIIGVMVDITDQKVAEARMREANLVALQANAALRDMTLEDNLTGLSNRRQFDLSLVHEFKRAIRSNLPLGLVLIDLDHFQAYNEQYGQEAGDACLRRIAQAVKTVPRRTGDLVARYREEEIAILLPLADHEGALRVAESILRTVQALRIAHAGSASGFLTISGGTAAFTGLADLNNPLELVRRADQALYKAKSDGRDRIVKYEPSLAGDLADPYAPALTQDMDRFIKSRA